MIGVNVSSSVTDSLVCWLEWQLYDLDLSYGLESKVQDTEKILLQKGEDFKD